jgi:hypothetical protein
MDNLTTYKVLSSRQEGALEAEINAYAKDNYNVVNFTVADGVKYVIMVRYEWEDTGSLAIDPDEITRHTDGD